MMRKKLLLAALFVLAIIVSIAFSQTSSQSSPQLLDLNTATMEELIAMPGVGDKYAAKIIRGRPYRMKTELLSKDIIPSKVYRKISRKIIAKQSQSY